MKIHQSGFNTTFFGNQFWIFISKFPISLEILEFQKISEIFERVT